jgi:SAM-dependent methyltransferase
MDSLEKRNSVMKDYDLIAKQYSEEFGTYIEDLDIYKEYEKHLTPGSTILDLGAGSGRTYAYFNKKGYKYIALDFSKKMKEYAYKIHGEFPYIVDDIVNIKEHFENDSIDSVFAIYSLFHLPLDDLKNTINNIYDILKEDGILFLSFALGNKEEFVDEPYLEENGRNVLYMNYLTKNEIYELLKNFDIIYETEKHESGDNVIGEDGNDAIYIISKKKQK